jgi:hypothetical protein
MAKPNGKANGQDGPAEPTLIPQDHGGAILSGGVPGNRGGPGRPPSQLRRRFSDLLYMGQADAHFRLQAQRKRLKRKDMKLLARKTKKQLLEMIREGAFEPEMTMGELRALLDTAAKYSIGSKHVIGTDEGDAPGVVLIPAIERLPDA